MPRRKIRRIHAFIGSPNDSPFMRWFIRCTWVAFALIIIGYEVAKHSIGP